MKTRLTIIAVIIICFIALHYFFGLFKPYNYLTAKWDILNNNPAIVVYGLPAETDQEAFALAPEFGFLYKRIGGSKVTKPLVNGAEQYNAVTVAYLDQKLGKEWKQRFDLRVDSLYRINRMDTIRKVVLAMPQNKEMNDYLDSVSGGKRKLYIWVLPMEKDNPNVRVGEMMPDSSVRIFDYYRVDPYSLQIASVQY